MKCLYFEYLSAMTTLFSGFVKNFLTIVSLLEMVIMFLEIYFKF